MSAPGAGMDAVRRRLVRVAALAAVAAACSGAPQQLPPPEAGERPWLLPASAYGTQRLFRCSYQGPGGDGGFRATLRLAAPDRFDLLLVDPLGRQLASLRVAGESALLVDHRRGTHCARLESAVLPGVGELPLLPQELPAVLLGALPVAPAEADDAAGSVGTPIELTDATGRDWRATIDDGLVVEWEVRQAGGPPWSWRRRGGRAATLSMAGGPRIEWQEVVIEALRSPLPPVAPLPGSQESCRITEGKPAT